MCSDGACGEERWKTGLLEPQIQAQRPWGATGFVSKRDVAPGSFTKGGEATAVQPRHRRQGYAPRLSVHPSGLVSCGQRRRKLGGRGGRLGLGAPSSLPWRLRRVFGRGQGHVAWRWVDPGGEGWGDRTEPGPGQHGREPWASNLCLPSAAPASLSVHCLQGLPASPSPSSSSSPLGPLQTFLLVAPLGSASGSSRWKPGMLLSVLLHTRRAPNNRKLPTHDTRRLRGNHQ